MKNIRVGWFLLALACAGVVIGAGFTDLDTTEHEGKIGLKKLITGIDANFAALEAGTAGIQVLLETNGAVNVTNNQTVTLVAGKINVLNGIGSAIDGTNAILLGVFATADRYKPTYISTGTTGTNLVSIARSGNFYGPAIELATNGGNCVVYATATNRIVGK